MEDEAMTRLWKITDLEGRTRRGEANETQWGAGVTHEAVGEKRVLCTDGVIHAYLSPELAVLINPAHAAINPFLLWEARGKIVVRGDGGLKVGCSRLTTVKVVEAPKASVEQRIEFGIRSALLCPQSKVFIAWAKKWLDGSERSSGAAQAADWAADWAAARAAARAAQAADWAAARAAQAAARAAQAAEWPAEAAEWPAEAAEWAAARAAAEWAAEADFCALARQVLR
jgi:hypothetical protein